MAPTPPLAEAADGFSAEPYLLVFSVRETPTCCAFLLVCSSLAGGGVLVPTMGSSDSYSSVRTSAIGSLYLSLLVFADVDFGEMALPRLPATWPPRIDSQGPGVGCTTVLVAPLSTSLI